MSLNDKNTVVVTYGNQLPLSEMVAPEVPWKAGDRVVSKFGDGPGTTHKTEDFEREQNVGVVFDCDPGALAWMSDDEVYKEEK